MIGSSILRRWALLGAFAVLTFFAGTALVRAQADACWMYYTIDVRSSTPDVAFPLFLAVSLESKDDGISVPHSFRRPTQGPVSYSLPAGYRVTSVDYNGANIPADGQPHRVYLVACHCCITITVNPDTCPVSIVVEELGDCD